MPTRIVLDTNPVPSQLTPHRQNQLRPVQLNAALRRNGETRPWSFDYGNSNTDNHDKNNNNNASINDMTMDEDLEFHNRGGGGSGGVDGTTNLRSRTTTTTTTANGAKIATAVPLHSSPSRRTSGFRSSILRELSVRQDYPGLSVMTVGNSASASEQYRNISGADIRASPRFLGYLFSAIAGSVLLVSVVQFLEKEVLDGSARTKFFNSTILPENARNKFFATASGDLIYQWKLWGSIYASACLVGLCICIMVAHYDTVLLPKLWVAIFRDGSLAERNLILFLILVWMAAVHVCTSSLSVGGVQANVYFTSWIAFGSMAMTFGVWRESAGLPTLMDLMNQHKRETTYNWFWIMIFSIVFAGAITDLYVNRGALEERFEGEIGDLETTRWLWVISVLWFEVLNCIIAIILNDLSTEPLKLPCTFTWSSVRYRFAFGWRQLEGIIMVGWMTVKFWVILEYTGVDGVINGLSNAYFGIWGSFFNSVFALGTWLRENQNLEYLVREEPEDSDRNNRR